MLNAIDLMNDINRLDLKRNKQRSWAIPIRDGSRGEKLTEKKSGRSLNEDDMLDAFKVFQLRSNPFASFCITSLMSSCI